MLKCSKLVSPRPPINKRKKIWLMDTFFNSIADEAFIKLTENIIFCVCLLLNIICSIIENILLGLSVNIYIQYIVLGIVSLLFIITEICHVKYTKKLLNDREVETGILSAYWRALLPEKWIEYVTIILGWVLLSIKSTRGVASFRGLRLFRYIWYCKYFVTDSSHRYRIIPYFVFYGHVVLQYFENIRKEIFTRNTKGAVAIFLIFYYLAFIIAVIVKGSITIDEEINPCDTLMHCFFTMLRISFYDGAGFDFIQLLLDSDHQFMATLLFCYLCISSIVLINGLIGIFGSAFSNIAIETVSSQNSSPVGTPMGTPLGTPLGTPIGTPVCSSDGSPSQYHMQYQTQFQTEDLTEDQTHETSHESSHDRIQDLKKYIKQNYPTNLFELP